MKLLFFAVFLSFTSLTYSMHEFTIAQEIAHTRATRNEVAVEIEAFKNFVAAKADKLLDEDEYESILRKFRLLAFKLNVVENEIEKIEQARIEYLTLAEIGTFRKPFDELSIAQIGDVADYCEDLGYDDPILYERDKNTHEIVHHETSDTLEEQNTLNSPRLTKSSVLSLCSIS